MYTSLSTKKINNFIAKTQFKITNIFFLLFLRAFNTYLFECVDMNISIQLKINNQMNERTNCCFRNQIATTTTNQTNTNHCTNGVQSCVNVYPSNRHTFTNTHKKKQITQTKSNQNQQLIKTKNKM